MKNVLKIGEMVEHSPDWLKDAVIHIARDAGIRPDNMELHRHSHSEKAKVNQIDPAKRQSLKYVSARTQDRDDEIVIPQAINLKEFMKYAHVLVNHNYSLLPVGSDEFIEADDFGIKALTNHADTGEGTLANVIWHLVSQGHMKASSIGFVPTSHTKPGDRNWDSVANKLQSTWKEFDKGRAEKSISRIITGGVLLEHSFVSVPCNTDAEMVGIVKGMGVDGKIIKQLGFDKGIVVVKKGMGGLSATVLEQELSQLLSTGSAGSSASIVDLFDDKVIFRQGSVLMSQPFSVAGGKVQLVGLATPVFERVVYVASPAAAAGADQQAEEEAAAEAEKVGAEEEELSEEKAFVAKGDLPGHEFRGNQWTDRPKGSGPSQTRVVGKLAGSKINLLSVIAGGNINTNDLSDRVFAKDDSGLISVSGLIPVMYYNEGEYLTFPDASRNDADHADFASVAVEGKDPDVNGTRGLLEVRSGTIAWYDVRSESEAIAANNNNTPARIRDVLEWNLYDAERQTFYVNGKKVLHETMVISDILGTKSFRALSTKAAPAEIKIVRPASSIKVLFAPPDPVVVAKGIGEAVERALSRRTGKLL